MTKQASFSELEYAAKKKQTRWDRFLAEIEAVTPWAAELERTITPFYPSSGGRGRPPIGLTRMLRMYVVQQCFGLSDEGVKDSLSEILCVRHNMSARRSMYAKQDEQEETGSGAAQHPERTH
ncbi:MAG: transposase [Azonexus sp.]